MPDQPRSRRSSLQSRRPSLTNDQLCRLLSLSHDDPSLRDVHSVVTIILNTGPRPGELQDLMWSNVDARKSRVLIPNYRNNRCVGRYVPFGAKTLQTLKALHDREPASEIVLGASAHRRLNWVSHKLRVLGREIGVVPISLSGLRHAFVTRFMAYGGSVDSLSTICGYKPGNSKFLSTLEQRFECAARDQARVENDLQ
jgi:integrase